MGAPTDMAIIDYDLNQSAVWWPQMMGNYFKSILLQIKERELHLLGKVQVNLTTSDTTGHLAFEGKKEDRKEKRWTTYHHSKCLNP